MHGDVADAERHGAHVHVGEIAVEQVGDDLRSRRSRTLPPGILRLVLKPLPGSVMRPLARASFISRHVVWTAGQHDEAALGAGDVDGRVEHQGQHFVEHAARAERAQAFEQRRELAQVVDGAGVRSIGVRRRRRRSGTRRRRRWRGRTARDRRAPACAR